MNLQSIWHEQPRVQIIRPFTVHGGATGMAGLAECRTRVMSRLSLVHVIQAEEELMF